ncbi:putative glycolipid-binding domain-containing protein [Thermobifida halotolerans]|uniref:Glycolipid-binding domain-containing protein n=1 Tax=Thermobifida halotolerans TaxID=483545 RepID=A0A399G0R3_9ACTN|nr:putative glycolipid-binding domain-containing protein [Thermobifida halotolerans]UOE18781.1 putative glycolipid-binding domain-containing protein [Thermobifida halotolerans]
MSPKNELPVAWSRLDVAEGLCVGTLVTERRGFRLEAGEVVADLRERYSCRFSVHTDLAWTTREARVDVVDARGTHTLELVNRAGQWTVNGTAAPELEGCVDVDVAAAPLTNTLPIRRLGLEPGEHRDIHVAWVDVPGLKVKRMRQRYTRLPPSEGLDRYEYRDSGFGAFGLTVDGNGMVVDYERLARRIP